MAWTKIIMVQVVKSSQMGYISKMELKVFVDGLSTGCERKQGVKIPEF